MRIIEVVLITFFEWLAVLLILSMLARIFGKADGTLGNEMWILFFAIGMRNLLMEPRYHLS